MTQQATVLWIDLEMTGLDPVEDRILEVAAIATDWDFRPIATFESAVKVDDAVVTARMEAGKAFWDANPAARDGLLAQNQQATHTAAAVETALLSWISQYFPDNAPVLLAGNSIHQDRKFIAHEWPVLDARLHYRMLDVSAWKVVFDGKYGKKFAKPESHRALEDIKGSIMELEYYLKKVKVGK